MKPTAMVPREALARKPKHGSPCNGCGLCCMATRCIVGKHLFGGEFGVCPALMRVDTNGYTCGAALMTSGPTRDAVMLLIRAGEGCDARFNGEWINAAFHRQQDEADARNADAIAQAKAMLGIKGD